MVIVVVKEGGIVANVILEQLADRNPEALTWDNCDDALIGIASRCGKPDLAVYSWDKLVEVFVGQGCSSEEAIEWVGFNLEGAWLGENTPLIMSGGGEDGV